MHRLAHVHSQKSHNLRSRPRLRRLRLCRRSNHLNLLLLLRRLHLDLYRFRLRCIDRGHRHRRTRARLSCSCRWIKHITVDALKKCVSRSVVLVTLLLVLINFKSHFSNSITQGKASTSFRVTTRSTHNRRKSFQINVKRYVARIPSTSLVQDEDAAQRRVTCSKRAQALSIYDVYIAVENEGG